MKSLQMHEVYGECFLTLNRVKHLASFGTVATYFRLREAWKVNHVT
jgi:hypothetical protein